MTVYELKYRHNERYPWSHYFDSDTLKFFGERLSSMRVLAKTEIVKDSYGKEHEAYCLSSLQRAWPSGPKRHYAYFDVKTFEHII